MSKLSPLFKRSFITVSILVALLVPCFGQQRAGSIRGQVSDALGALVVGATVTLIAADGTQKTVVSGNDGTYTINTMTPGRYTLRVTAPGCMAYENTEVDVTAGARTTQDVQLVVGIERQVITVTEERGLDVDPASNADAVVLRGSDIDVLPDDPDALASAVQKQWLVPQLAPAADRYLSTALPVDGCRQRNRFAKSESIKTLSTQRTTALALATLRSSQSRVRTSCVQVRSLTLVTRV